MLRQYGCPVFRIADADDPLQLRAFVQQVRSVVERLSQQSSVSGTDKGSAEPDAGETQGAEAIGTLASGGVF